MIEALDYYPEQRSWVKWAERAGAIGGIMVGEVISSKLVQPERKIGRNALRLGIDFVGSGLGSGVVAGLIDRFGLRYSYDEGLVDPLEDWERLSEGTIADHSASVQRTLKLVEEQ